MWTVCVADFGTDGIAVQTAIDLAYSRGGGIVSISPNVRYTINTNINVKQGVTLQGDYPPTPFTNIFTRGGVFVLNSANTIAMEAGSALKGFAIIRSGLVNSSDPAFNANCAGTAVTITNASPGILSDIEVSDMFIMGFAQAVTTNNAGRLFISHIVGDNRSGISIEASLDVSHIDHCHFWPYGTTGTAGGALNNRSGIAYQIIGPNDWGDITNSFCFGYSVGYFIDSVHTFDFVNCGADNTALNPGSIGFSSTNCIALAYTACKAAANAIGFQSVSDVDLVTMTGCRSWANSSTGIKNNGSIVNMSGCSVFDNTTYGVDVIAAGVSYFTYGGFHGNGANTHTAGGGVITVV